MKVCVFLGPSLPLAEARAILDAVYLSPAGQGDVYRAVRDRKADAIGLIDGFFEQMPAVWHKEILWALKQGVRVYGASSMGALRAAELEQFGMIGIGKVFEAYRSGLFPPFSGETFEDDDEVAIAHGPAELGYLGSDAMVDIRATLAAAESQGIIDRACRDRLAEIAKGLFYKDRSYERLVQLARGASELSLWMSGFEDWLPGGKVSQKRLDAEALLTSLARGVGGRPVPAFRLEPTAAWDAALRAMDETAPGPE